MKRNEISISFPLLHIPGYRTFVAGNWSEKVRRVRVGQRGEGGLELEPKTGIPGGEGGGGIDGRNAQGGVAGTGHQRHRKPVVERSSNEIAMRAAMRKTRRAEAHCGRGKDPRAARA